MSNATLYLIRPEFQVHLLNEKGKKEALKVAAVFSEALDKLETLCNWELSAPAGEATGSRMDYLTARQKLVEASFFAKRAIAQNPDNQWKGGPSTLSVSDINAQRAGLDLPPLEEGELKAMSDEDGARLAAEDAQAQPNGDDPAGTEQDAANGGEDGPSEVESLDEDRPRSATALGHE
jgi:hypothetical protein